MKLMLKRRINISILVVIILCSTSLYKFAFLGSMQKGLELLGAGIIFLLIVLHLVYSNQKSIKQNYSLPIILIILALFTSTAMAYIAREQRVVFTLFAQRAMYYYLLYFLLHQLKFDPKDLEKIIIVFGLVYVGLFLLQTVLYPKVLFNANIRVDRGTIRIYLPGSVYMAASFYIALQHFLRSNKFKHLFLLLLIFSIHVMTGGRQSLAIVVFVTVLFIIIDKRVQSRFFLIFLGIVGSFAIFIIFQSIFMELFNVSQKNVTMGEEYIRIKASRYYLTEFFESPVAYITGNGMYYPHSSYGKLITLNSIRYHYNLGDIGLIANYALYGIFFVIGVLIICFKSLFIKINSEHTYIKYMFLAIILSLMTSGGFADSSFICFITIVLYLIDVSNEKLQLNISKQ